MGITSENVAEKFKITRSQQDQFAVASHQKAFAAQQQGLFNDEIIPVSAKVIDKDGAEKTIVVKQDDGVRADSSTKMLNKLKPAFKEDGCTTAGNASQVSDGAAAVLFMKRKTAEKLGFPVLARWISFAAVGVPPNIMGVGPAFAIPAALKKAGLGVADIDVYEINEAFASQALYSIHTLGIPMEKVNPKGGAIALGTPNLRKVSTN